jgi:hypothetical protein
VRDVLDLRLLRAARPHRGGALRPWVALMTAATCHLRCPTPGPRTAAALPEVLDLLGYHRPSAPTIGDLSGVVLNGRRRRLVLSARGHQAHPLKSSAAGTDIRTRGGERLRVRTRAGHQPGVSHADVHRYTLGSRTTPHGAHPHPRQPRRSRRHVRRPPRWRGHGGRRGRHRSPRSPWRAAASTSAWSRTLP